MQTKKQLENLRPPWKPGVSANPGGLPGRPKRKPITDAYQAIINDPLPDHLRKVPFGRREIVLREGATFADLLALGQWAAAVKGNTAAAEEICNRLEGKVAVEVDVVAGTLGDKIAAARLRLKQLQANAEMSEDGNGTDPQKLT